MRRRAILNLSLFALALACWLPVSEGMAAQRCRSNDMACRWSETRQAVRPGNGHYWASRNRTGNYAQPAPCGTRPHLTNPDAVLNEPACR